MNKKIARAVYSLDELDTNPGLAFAMIDDSPVQSEDVSCPKCGIAHDEFTNVHICLAEWNPKSPVIH